MTTPSTSDHKTNIIFVEGCDGTGKTSVAKGIVAELQARGKSAIYIPIMDGSAVGKDYRVDYISGNTVPVTEALGMLYSVTKTLLDVVAPAQKLYDYVVVDRSLASFYAYQLYSNEYWWMEAAYKKVLESTPVGLTIYLQVNPGIALERMRQRGIPLDVIENRGVSYQMTIAAGYEDAFSIHPLTLAPECRITTDELPLGLVISTAVTSLGI